MITKSVFWHVWDQAHAELRKHLENWVDVPKTLSISSRAIGRWFEAAADGIHTPAGPYALLFSSAHYVMSHDLGMYLLVTEGEMRDRIPAGYSRLPWLLSKVYVEIWALAALEGWSRTQIHQVALYISDHVPLGPDNAYQLNRRSHTDTGPELLRRAAVTAREHDCERCEYCAGMYAAWDIEDLRTREWYETHRLAKEGI